MPLPAAFALLVLGLAALVRSVAVEDGASIIFALVFLALVVFAVDRPCRKRHRSAHADLSVLGRDGERIAFTTKNGEGFSEAQGTNVRRIA